MNSLVMVEIDLTREEPLRVEAWPITREADATLWVVKERRRRYGSPAGEREGPFSKKLLDRVISKDCQKAAYYFISKRNPEEIANGEGARAAVDMVAGELAFKLLRGILNLEITAGEKIVFPCALCERLNAPDEECAGCPNFP